MVNSILQFEVKVECLAEDVTQELQMQRWTIPRPSIK